jgi:CrcB protein
MSAWVWIAVAFLGGLGALARVLVSSLIAARLPRLFPTGTLAVNATGTFLLGLLTGLSAGGTLLVLAGGATLGSYTTFSTWMLETHRLAQDGERGTAVVNVVLSASVGIAAAAIGHAIGAQF